MKTAGVGTVWERYLFGSGTSLRLTPAPAEGAAFLRWEGALSVSLDSDPPRQEVIAEADDGVHSADKNTTSGTISEDYLIQLGELLRVIQFFNIGGVECDVTNPEPEDGYKPRAPSAAGDADTTCTPHDSDYKPQDWRVSLSELLRLIQFFNSGGYNFCPEANTEDWFCPGL